MSTLNPNMPIRGLIYFARNYEAYIERNHLDIYSSVLQKLPLPQYIVFYNGSVNEDERTLLELKNAFPVYPGKESCLNCIVTMLNINYGHNKELMNRCQKLKEYALFIYYIRMNVKNNFSLEDAIQVAIDNGAGKGYFMHNMDIRNINFGQLEYFVKTVELGSFTKTAEYMHVSQSTVSKSILSLEQMLGIPLFWREKRAIRLTPAGHYLYGQWKKLALTVEMNVHEAHVIQAGFFRSLAIGSLDSYNPEMFIMPAIKNFKDRHCQVNLRVETSPAQDLRQMLLDDELDIVFTVLYEIEQLGMENFEVCVLGECTHLAAMLKSNYLAAKKELHVEELKEAHFVAISPLVTPSYTVMLTQLCQTCGFSPNITCYTASAVALAFNLMDENDIFICDKFYQGIVNPALVTVPLEGTKSGFVMAWKKANKKPEVLNFVQETKSFLKNL